VAGAVHLDADGTVTWSTPDGRTWVTRPRLLAIGEQLTAAGADPQLLHDLARGWHPGLPVGMSVDELLAAEQLVPPDPPESGQVPEPPPDWVELDASPAGPDGRVAA
jgi:hypothetical protein